MTTATAAAVQRRDGSSLEYCGFVLHILCIPVALLYLAWALLHEASLQSCGMTYYPPKSWAILIPTSLVSAFVAAPLLYAACNILATPRVDSIDAIWDEYSREPCAEVEPASNNGSIVPAIYDIDVVTINDLVDSNGVDRQTEDRR